MVHDCEDTVRVRVEDDGEWTRIPLAEDGVEVRVRKDGPVAINRVSELWFPDHLEGVPYTNVVSALDPTRQNVYDRARVEYRQSTDDGWVVVHDGFVLSAGSTGSNRLRRARIAGYEQLLDAIPASTTFTHSTAADVIEYVQETFVAGQPVLDELPTYIGTVGGEFVNAYDVPEGVDSSLDAARVTVELAEDTLQGLDILSGEPASKEFTANRHSLQDVLDWASKRLSANGETGVYFTFELVDGQPSLVARSNPTRYRIRDQSAGGNVHVYEHNALYEISPINAVTVRGRTRYSETETVESWLFPDMTIATDSSEIYPQATVQHPELVDRANGVLRPPVQESEATTIAAATADAKAILKRSLDKAGGGDITTRPTPQLRPYTEFVSNLACDDASPSELGPISFEVESATHRFPANGRDETQVQVSMFVDPSDITTLDDKTGMFEA